jgi:hypothetical protein
MFRLYALTMSQYIKPSRFLVLILLPLLLGSSLHGQEKKAGREVIVRCLSFNRMKVDKEIYLHSQPVEAGEEGVKMALKTYLNHERETIDLVGDEVIFSRTSEAAGAEKDSIARARIPAKWKRVLFVFFPLPKEPDPNKQSKYRLIALDDSTQAFPRGSILCYNLSPNKARLMLEDEQYDVDSGATRVIKDPPANAANHCGMYAYEQKDDKWHRIGAGLWPHPGTKRILQFFYMDPVSNRVQLKGIKDISIQ